MEGRHRVHQPPHGRGGQPSGSRRDQAATRLARSAHRKVLKMEEAGLDQQSIDASRYNRVVRIDRMQASQFGYADKYAECRHKIDGQRGQARSVSRDARD